MNELYQVHDTHGRPKIADNIYCFQLPSPEPVVWRANSTVWSCTSQLTALQPDPPTQSPIHDVASSNPSCETYPTGRLRTWPSSVLFRSWRMLECKFTTQDHRCPWVSASSNNRLGSSIWAAIISARYCFVYFGSRMETLFYISPGGESSSSKRGSDVVLVTIQNLPVLMTTGYPISFPSVLKMWFFGMQAVSGRISRQKDYA